MQHPLIQIAKLFLKLGTISFGGPAAHIAMMEHEVVRRRGWLSGERFLDLIGATHLIPGPNAVEMASHIGYCRAGLLGSLVGGLCFTLPAALISAMLAASYLRYGSLPQIEPFLQGIKPVVLAVIFTAVWRLGGKALNCWQLVLVGVGVAAGSLAGGDEIMALLLGTLIGVLVLRVSRWGASPPSKATAGMLAGLAVAGTAGRAPAAGLASGLGAVVCGGTSTAVPLWKLGLFFMKVGAVLFGGGYVLVAYLEGDLVGDYGWLTERQLLDAVAIGQLTPGPMLSTATFVGYLVAGASGAVVATLGILLPSFVLVAAVNPLIPRLRRSRWTSAFLDAVNAASIGLMVAVAVKLTAATLVDWPSRLIALLAVVVSLRWKVAPAWLVVAGAAAGRLLY